MHLAVYQEPADIKCKRHGSRFQIFGSVRERDTETVIINEKC